MAQVQEVVTVKNFKTGESREAFHDLVGDKIVDANGIEFDWHDWYVSEPLSPKIIQAFAWVIILAIVTAVYTVAGGLNG